MTTSFFGFVSCGMAGNEARTRRSEPRLLAVEPLSQILASYLIESLMAKLGVVVSQIRTKVQESKRQSRLGPFGGIRQFFTTEKW